MESLSYNLALREWVRYPERLAAWQASPGGRLRDQLDHAAGDALDEESPAWW